uniref:IlGF domain-containing protein n=1 Tax=Steinernema glaseri TaxID=37863 RepID=A0A1I7Z9L6_9BILA
MKSCARNATFLRKEVIGRLQDLCTLPVVVTGQRQRRSHRIRYHILDAIMSVAWTLDEYAPPLKVAFPVALNSSRSSAPASSVRLAPRGHQQRTSVVRESHPRDDCFRTFLQTIAFIAGSQSIHHGLWFIDSRTYQEKTFPGNSVVYIVCLRAFALLSSSLVTSAFMRPVFDNKPLAAGHFREDRISLQNMQQRCQVPKGTEKHNGKTFMEEWAAEACQKCIQRNYDICKDAVEHEQI